MFCIWLSDHTGNIFLYKRLAGLVSPPPLQASNSEVTGVPFRAVSQAGCEVDHSPDLSGAVHLLLLYAFMVW